MPKKPIEPKNHPEDADDNFNANESSESIVLSYEDQDPQTFSVVVGEQTLSLICHPFLEVQAQWALQTVVDFVTKENPDSTTPLTDGYSIEFGWSLVTISQDEENANLFVLCEPDFDEDPFAGMMKDLTRTLLVIMQMNAAITHTDTAETARIPRFDETIVMRKGALESERIYLERAEFNPDNESDSGWFIGIVTDSPDSTSTGADSLSASEKDEEDLSPEDFEAMYVFELLYHRPDLLALLGLPTGYVVILEGEEITAILGPDNENQVTTFNLN
jgi:hypothetical protein